MNFPILNPLNPSFVFEARNSIIQATTFGVPLAVEMIWFSVNLYRDPNSLKENFLIGTEKLEKLTESFKLALDNTAPESQRQALKNISKAALGALFIAGSATTAYFLVPPAFSNAGALIAIQLSGKMWEGINQIPETIKNASDYISDAFNKRENESVNEFEKRRSQAIKEIACYTALFAGAVAMVGGMGYVGYLLANAESVWQLSEALPAQTKSVVFLEYAFVGAAHAAQAVHNWSKDNQSGALFHLISATSAIAFPVSYIMEGGVVRLHHSFIGLALQLLPFRAVKCLGSAITIDSFLNSYLGWQGLVRGQVLKNRLNETIVFQYDYQNALLAHLPFAVTSVASFSLLGKNLDIISSKNDIIDIDHKKPKDIPKSLESSQ